MRTARHKGRGEGGSGGHGDDRCLTVIEKRVIKSHREYNTENFIVGL